MRRDGGRHADGTERGRILSEFVESTGFHRVYAAWLLRGHGKRVQVEPGMLVEGAAKVRIRRPQRRSYGPEVTKVPKQVWETMDYICGKRLVPRPVGRGAGESGMTTDETRRHRQCACHEARVLRRPAFVDDRQRRVEEAPRGESAALPARPAVPEAGAAAFLAARSVHLEVAARDALLEARRRPRNDESLGHRRKVR